MSWQSSTDWSSGASERGDDIRNAEMVAMRSEALSLLKKKMRLGKKGKQTQHRTCDAALIEDPSGATQNRTESQKLGGDDGTGLRHAIEPQARPADAPGDTSIHESKAESSLAHADPMKLRERRHELNSLKQSHDQREKNEEMTIAQLKRMTVVFEGASISKRNRDGGEGDDATPRTTATANTTTRMEIKSASSTVAETARPREAMKNLKKLVVKWTCRTCKRECIPIREESRCLCGHRYKEHPSTPTDPRVKHKADFHAFACTSAKCACTSFFYVVAEGAWILRCRCKHKHIDHDPSGKPFRCKKPKCACSGFDSPWICNCDHPWTDHEQEIVEKEFRPLQLLQERFAIEELSAVHRTDLLAEPLMMLR